MRRTRRNSHNLGALDVVSAWASETGLTLGQVAVEAKSHEITAMPLLLELLDLRDKSVTIDAAGCQKEIAATIVAGKGDYVLAAQDNQPTLVTEITAALAEVEATPLPARQEYTTEEKGHGRQERRTVRVLPVGQQLSQRAMWVGVLSLVRVIRVVTCVATGVVSTEVGY